MLMMNSSLFNRQTNPRIYGIAIVVAFVIVLSLYIRFSLNDGTDSKLRPAESTQLGNSAHYLPIPDINTFSKSNTNNNYRSFLSQEYRKREEEAFRRLFYVEPDEKSSWANPIADVIVAYPIPESMGVHILEKYVVGPSMLHSLQQDFVIYAAGIADAPDFEETLAQRFNVSVHAFDCTISEHTKLKNGVHFHHWCLGQEKTNLGFENNEYSQKSKNKTFVFHSLSETKKLLGHRKIHALKMDIEGYEWEILQHNILDNPNTEDLPDQIMIELHAIGANPKFVPIHLTHDRTRRKVNELVLALWQKGYRVVDKVTNRGDPHCADITFLRIHN